MDHFDSPVQAMDDDDVSTVVGEDIDRSELDIKQEANPSMELKEMILDEGDDNDHDDIPIDEPGSEIHFPSAQISNGTREGPPYIPESVDKKVAGKKKPREGTAPQWQLRNSITGPRLSLHSGSDTSVQIESVYLYLSPLNDSFTSKCIKVPFYPETLQLGRHVSARTVPTPDNGFFDSRVLSRQHAQIWADQTSGQVWIRDIKSSNGTFINGERLSPEGEESEPHELKVDDVIDLGVNISSEDAKGDRSHKGPAIVHNKVSARIERIGFDNTQLSDSKFGILTNGVNRDMTGNGSFGFGPGGSSDPRAMGGNRSLSTRFAEGNESYLSRAGLTNGGKSVLGNGMVPAASLASLGPPGRAKQRIISRLLAPANSNTMKGPISMTMLIKKIGNEVVLARDQMMELQRVSMMLEDTAREQVKALQSAAAERGSGGGQRGGENISTENGADKGAGTGGNSDEGSIEAKIMSLTLAVARLEKDLADTRARKAELERMVENESFARQQAESRLAIVEKELEIEREQVISELQEEAEEEFNDEEKVKIEDAAAADTMALIDKEEARQRRLSGGTLGEDGEEQRGKLNIGQLLAQLEQTRKEAQIWKMRAIRAERKAERKEGEERSLKLKVAETQGGGGSGKGTIEDWDGVVLLAPILSSVGVVMVGVAMMMLLNR
ncbi:uncharacterized protein V1516DRAFT_665501 [Lipomyces oligophaga]|uniref:uncharacterized protein n=1 Tax=Lipomyces oligophaga TaxID=45792 RepID=UPI0034CEB770